MYFSQRKIIFDIINALEKLITDKNITIDTVEEVVSDCMQMVVQIDDFLSENCSIYTSDVLQDVANGLSEFCTCYGHHRANEIPLINTIEHARNYIKSLPVRSKVVFMPYIVSMWSAMESIWKAAEDDENCDAYIVPIPYWKLKMDDYGNTNKTELVYEGGNYPNYLPITHYTMFDLEREQPDIIFIHNPYDQFNNLTRVPEEYYSTNLKKFTSLLVYSPYYMRYLIGPGQHLHALPVYSAMDYILIQSEKLANWYFREGLNRQKFLLLGSPKTDHIVSPICAPVIKREWLEKSAGKKVILLNTHMLYILLAMPGYNGQPVQYGLAVCLCIIDTILSMKDCTLLWRPHPLILKMLEGRGAIWHKQQIEDAMKRVENACNGILDLSPDYLSAFELSDAMISVGGSSLIGEYLLTGKPVTDGSSTRDDKETMETAQLSPFDLTTLYFAEDFMSKQEQTDACVDLSESSDAMDKLIENYYHVFYSRFVRMICEGDDPLCERRMNATKKAFINGDGTCGYQVYKTLKSYL